MKTEIENLLKSLGIQGYLFEDNIDDYNSCFSYNEHPNTLIRILFPMSQKDDPYLTIEKYRIHIYNLSVKFTSVLSGPVLLTNEGDFDSDFYSKILSNLNLFK